MQKCTNTDEILGGIILKKFSFFAVLAAIVMFSLALSHEIRAESGDPSSVTTPPSVTAPPSITTPDTPLPTVDSEENLRLLLAEAEKLNSRYYYAEFSVFNSARNGVDLFIAEDQSGSGAPPGTRQEPAASDLKDGDYSTTNIQVEGVDEADLIKNDGEYLYQVNRQEIIVAQIYPSDSMRVVSRVSFDPEEFTPQELYLDANYLVVVGSHFSQQPYPVNYAEGVETRPETGADSDANAETKTDAEAEYYRSVYPPYYTKTTTKALIYDVQDKSSLQKIREVELEGNYVSSRKIGSSLYLIANKYVYAAHHYPFPPVPLQPCYRDTVIGEQYVDVDYSNIYYFPNFLEPNYLLIGGIDLEQRDQEMQVSTYLGSAQNIYASASNLYTAVTQYQAPDPDSGQENPVPPPGWLVPRILPNIGIIAPEPSYPQPLKTVTALYKFGLDQGSVSYKGQGQVPGVIVNQFSMDEYDGFFRIATTSGDIWRTDSPASARGPHDVHGIAGFSAHSLQGKEVQENKRCT